MNLDDLVAEHRHMLKDSLVEGLEEVRAEAERAFDPNATYKLGHAGTHTPKLALGDYLSANATAPPSVHRGLFAGYTNVLANDTLGDCITPDVRVLTADLRWVPAGELSVGDKLLAFEEQPRGGSKGRRYCEATVEKAHIVRRPCFELEFEDGTLVRSSSGHRWLVRSTEQGSLGTQKWQETQELRVESPRQTRVIKSLMPWEVEGSYEAGYLAAAFDGEGTLATGHPREGREALSGVRLAFTQTENEMLAEVESCMRPFAHTHTSGQASTILRVDGTPRKIKHTITISRRAEWLRFMGSIRPRRLLSKVDLNSLGRIDGDAVALVRKTFVGEQDVVMLDTSARTYFAEGLASHNCGEAMVVHGIEGMRHAAGTTVPSFVAQDAVNLYEPVGGYIPGDPSTDQGTDNDVLVKYWESPGVTCAADNSIHTIAGSIAVDPTNDLECQIAVYEFASLFCEWNMPITAQGQSTWKVVGDGQTGDSAPGSWGGHDTVTLAYSGSTLDINTWGLWTPVEKAFRAAYAIGFFAVVAQDMLGRTGVSPTGLDWTALVADLQKI
jgi:hypothetical protein